VNDVWRGKSESLCGVENGARTRSAGMAGNSWGKKGGNSTSSRPRESVGSVNWNGRRLKETGRGYGRVGVFGGNFSGEWRSRRQQGSSYSKSKRFSTPKDLKRGSVVPPIQKTNVFYKVCMEKLRLSNKSRVGGGGEKSGPNYILREGGESHRDNASSRCK